MRLNNSTHLICNDGSINRFCYDLFYNRTTWAISHNGPSFLQRIAQLATLAVPENRQSDIFMCSEKHWKIRLDFRALLLD